MRENLSVFIIKTRGLNFTLSKNKSIKRETNMKKFFALSLAALVLGGCGSISTEKVCIKSAPEGADVYIGGELKGKAPMCVELDKNVPHDVVLKKCGYKDASFSLASSSSDPFVKIVPLAEAGYYKTLSPNPVDAKLLPTFLPESTKPNNFDGLADAVNKANKLKKDGVICEHEYTVMIATIQDFFAPNACEEMEQAKKAKCEAAKAAEAKKCEEAAKAEAEAKAKIRCTICNK